jgi:MFS superfamily sulfate permease-like transporter
MIQTLVSFGINTRDHPHFVLTGVVPSGLPSPAWPPCMWYNPRLVPLISYPSTLSGFIVNGSLISDLYASAILMALLAFIEGMAIGKVFARKGNYVRQFDANQEVRFFMLPFACLHVIMDHNGWI